MKLGLEALRRFRRNLSIDLLYLRYTAASEDPGDAALQYGYISALLGSLLSALSQIVTVKREDVATAVNFEMDKPYVEARLITTLRIGQILGIAIYCGIGYLKLKIRRNRALRAKEREDSHGQAAGRRTDGDDSYKDKRAG